MSCVSSGCFIKTQTVVLKYDIEAKNNTAGTYGFNHLKKVTVLLSIDMTGQFDRLH